MQPKLERIQLGEKASILAFQYEGEIFDAPWHFHPQHELTFIQESKGTKFIGDYVGPYEKGELVLVRSNLPHCWKNTVQKKKKAKSIVIQWNKGIYSKVPELKSIFSMLNSASKGIIFKSKDVKKLLPLIKNTVYLEDTLLYLQLQQILVTLSNCRYYTLSETSFTDDLPNKISSRINMIHEFIDANYHRKINLREFADLVNMSEQSFSRFFSKTMGRSVFTFLTEYRINMANRMLVDSDLSVAEIGFKSGFESLTFFHKKFKQYMKCSPNNFRKKYRYKKNK